MESLKNVFKKIKIFYTMINIIIVQNYYVQQSIINVNTNIFWVNIFEQIF